MPLPPDVLRRLRAAALTVQRRARAPYSNFHVGAALLMQSGRIVAGCNVENASYGLTICAERNAIGRAVAEAAGLPVACVVVGPTDRPLTPCGACRQVLNEFNPAMAIICIGKRGELLETTAGALLPASFGSDALDEAAGKS